MRRQVRALTADLDATLGQMDEAITDGESRLTTEEEATPTPEEEPAPYEPRPDVDEDGGDDLEAQDETEEGSYSDQGHTDEAPVNGDEGEESFTPVPESSPLDRLPSIEELEAGIRPQDSPEEDAELAVTSESEDTYDPMYDTGERAARPWEQ
jgi:hypothetical protein